MNKIHTLILAAVALAAAALFAPSIVTAQVVPADTLVLAQVAAPDPFGDVAAAVSDRSALDAQPSTGSSTPWYLSTEFFAALFSAVAGIVAVVQSQGKTKAQKINEALVIGIEAATRIPAVAQAEKRIKATIREKAHELGVQPVLHRLVKDLT